MRPVAASIVFLALVALRSAGAAAADRPAVLAPLAPHSLLLAGAVLDDRIVVVGARGHVLLSFDDGRSWRQVPVPSRGTLTAVSFADARRGWAVGHESLVLHTHDGGETWERLATDLPPGISLLDALFVDAARGFVCGAYGALFVTSDGGRTWARREPLAGEEPHLNRLARTADGTLYLAGESGTLLRSADDGETWEILDADYAGSFFGIVPLRDDGLLAYGLQGRLRRSADRGDTWDEIAAPAPTSIFAGHRRRDGVVLLGGASGNVFVSRDDGRTFTLWHPADSAALSELLETREGAVVTLGVGGVRRHALPSPLGGDDAGPTEETP